MEDPNWFFSTLAQSAAAIVGLIGAFLVSRIVEQANEVRGKKKEIMGRITILGTEIDRAKADSERLKELYSTDIRNLNYESKKEKSSINDPTLGIMIQLPNKNLQFITNLFSEGIGIFEDRRKFLSDIGFRPIYVIQKSMLYYTNISKHLAKWGDAPHKGISIDSGKLKRCFENIIEFDEKLKMIKIDHDNFVNSFVLPSYFKYGLYILGFIAIFCVIVPLYFLSAGNYHNEKIVLMSLFILGIMGILIFFKHQIYEIEKFVKLKKG